ncbi:hypothetical protein KM043_018436 [Ampulex compressa]|nr:hypothetical protein KM043_018436 [Ampulex compressa]
MEGAGKIVPSANRPNKAENSGPLSDLLPPRDTKLLSKPVFASNAPATNFHCRPSGIRPPLPPLATPGTVLRRDAECEEGDEEMSLNDSPGRTGGNRRTWPLSTLLTSLESR